MTGSNDPQDRIGLAAGTYTVTVTDANGCTAMESYTITEPNQLILTGEVTDVLCTGDENSKHFQISLFQTYLTYLLSVNRNLD